MDRPNQAHAAPDDARALDGLDRRQALQRLVVGGAIVWSAPLISRTAYAAGPTSCTNNVVDWNSGSFTTGQTFSSTTVNGTTITLGPSSFFGGSAARSTNRTIIASPIGGYASRGLQLEQDAVTNGGQDVALNFSKTVYSVSFTITDIDNLNNGWSDRVAITSPATYTFSVPTTFVGGGPTGAVIGNGKNVSPTSNAVGPFRNSNTNFNYSNSQNNGNVTLSFPGPLTSIGLRFSCVSQQGSNQLIKFSNISFCA